MAPAMAICMAVAPAMHNTMAMAMRIPAVVHVHVCMAIHGRGAAMEISTF